jgi:cell division septation protein DedD
LIKIKDKKLLLLSGMVALAVSITIAWFSLSEQQPDETALSGAGRPDPHQAGASRSMSPEKMATRINGLIRRVDDLSDRMTSGQQDTTESDPATTIEPAERQVMAEAALLMESLPPPAAGKTGKAANVAAAIELDPPGKPDRVLSEPPASLSPSAAIVVAEQSSSPTPPDTATRLASVMEPHDPVTKELAAVNRDNNAPWVINLVSTTNKAEADRFAENALSRGIQTVQQQITLKGRQYWRVQIAGFSTKEDASAYADTAREKLSLKNVWIMKR